MSLEKSDYKRIRQSLGMTQNDMGKMLKRHTQVIGHWECGVRNPDPLVIKLFELFDTLPEEDITKLMDLLNQ